MDRTQIIHAVCTATAIVGVALYYHYQLSKVTTELSKQNERLVELEKHINAQDYAIRRMMDVLGGPEALDPRRSPDIPTRSSPKKVKFEDESEDVDKKRQMREDMGVDEEDDDISSELQDLNR
jgi:hypothetical protein